MGDVLEEKQKVDTEICLCAQEVTMRIKLLLKSNRDFLLSHSNVMTSDIGIARLIVPAARSRQTGAKSLDNTGTRPTFTPLTSSPVPGASLGCPEGCTSSCQRGNKV